MKAIFRMFAAGLVLFLSIDANAASRSNLVMEEFMVPAADAGINLYVRNKHPEGMNTFPAEKILLFVHGSTYPAETMFDLQVGGMSWMDYIARHGYDVYLVDLRGYSKSTRPPQMDRPAAENEPIVRTVTAVKDVGSAVDFILKRRGVSKLNLLGWSWGTTIMATYTTKNNHKVNKLVLYAPQWIRSSNRSSTLAENLVPIVLLRAPPLRIAGSMACPRIKRRRWSPLAGSMRGRTLPSPPTP